MEQAQSMGVPLFVHFLHLHRNRSCFYDLPLSGKIVYFRHCSWSPQYVPPCLHSVAMEGKETTAGCGAVYRISSHLA